MKRFLLQVLSFVILMVAVDRVGGYVLMSLTHSARGGVTAQMRDVDESLSADMIVLGSSRSVHHYVSTILSDSLELSCYNCGNDGQGILSCYAKYEMMARHHSPRVVIYEAFADFDLQKSDNSKYLSCLRPYYDNPYVSQLFADVDATEPYKMQSRLFRFNGKSIEIVADQFRHPQDSLHGYIPMYGSLDYDIAQMRKYRQPEYDPLKIRYCEKLIRSCAEHGSQLIFVVSPFYRGNDQIEVTYAPLMDLCEKYGVPFINEYANSDFCTDMSLFKDFYHLNDAGARAYSSYIAARLRPFIPKS